MLTLRFFSRVAFICNICFLLTLIITRVEIPSASEIFSSIIVIGVLLATVINCLVNFTYCILLVLRKPFQKFIPIWLIIANFLFLIPQLIVFFK